MAREIRPFREKKTNVDFIIAITNPPNKNKLQVHTSTILDGSGNGICYRSMNGVVFMVLIGKSAIPVESMKYIDIPTKT